MNVAGASVPGTPGVVIGRNERVGWGFAAVMTDYVDLYAVRVDPARPTTYYVKGRKREMEREELTLDVAGRSPDSERITIHRTEFGPVITSLEEGVDAAACLKWYGTLPDDELPDTTVSAFFAMQKAESVVDLIDISQGYVTACFNITAADADGHIGWHAMGRAPVRKGHSGRVPADASSGRCAWAGFLPYAKMPHLLDPRGGRIVTANQRTQTDKDKVPMTSSWDAPYRFERINQLLDGLESPTADDFARMQLDDFSPQAALLAPTIVAQRYTHPDAELAASLLRDWDFRMAADSTGALVFGVFLVELAQVLTGGLLREDIGLYLSFLPYYYGAADRLLDPASPPDPATHPLLQGRPLQFICEETLIRTVRLIRRALGRRRGGWKWGRLHTYNFRHLGAAGGVGAWLLWRGRYPAPGNGATLNVGGFNAAVARGYRPTPLERYEVDVIPSLRMICAMADPDGTRIVGPLGQSGQPGSRHYDDLMPLWLSGRYVKLPLTRKGAESIAVATLTLAGR